MEAADFRTAHYSRNRTADRKTRKADRMTLQRSFRGDFRLAPYGDICIDHKKSLLRFAVRTEGPEIADFAGRGLVRVDKLLLNRTSSGQ